MVNFLGRLGSLIITQIKVAVYLNDIFKGSATTAILENTVELDSTADSQPIVFKYPFINIETDLYPLD